MWFPGEEWQCPGCTGFTSQFTRLDFLEGYDARFVIVTQGPINEALAYKARVGNKMTWYSTAGSSFGTDMGAPPDGGFQVNVFLRVGTTVFRTYNTQGRGTEQLSYTFPLIRSAPLRTPGGVAGLAGGLAAVPDLQSVGPLGSVRPIRRRRLTRMVGGPGDVNGDAGKPRRTARRRRPSRVSEPAVRDGSVRRVDRTPPRAARSRDGRR